MIGQTMFTSPMQEAKQATAVMNTPAIVISLENLEKELHLSREMIMTLNQRLSSILRPEPAKESRTSQVAPVGGSPMCSHIETLTYLAKATGDDARSMLDRLEL